MSFLLTINDVVARTGTRTSKFTIPGKELVDGVQVTLKSLSAAARSRYMVLSLPKRFGQFMRIRPDLSARSYRHGQEARDFCGALLRSPADVLRDNHFVVIGIEHLVSPDRDGNAGGDLKLNILVDVDTDHPALVAAIDAVDPMAGGRAAAKATKVPPVTMRVDVVMIDEDRQAASSRVDIDLLLMPMRNMPIHAGYAAIDFGNTSTALVLSDTNQRDQFELVAADTRRATASPRPVQTALRITAVRSPDAARGFQQYESVIGSDALKDADAGWLVLGAKRLLSDRKAGAARDNSVVLGDRIHQIPAEDPAEVFISRMLQGMFFHRQCRPQSVAVTCPTTFTVSEVARLKRTVARAFLRATGGKPEQAGAERIDSFVPLVIDEASAAAFYFAYRDFIVGPGQMPAFRYLYPNGLHMLLYDCGGGTTDMALVRIEATSAGEVDIRVLGRTGHRRFGGDFITWQVFRLLKAKLAALKGQIPDVPKATAKIAEFLDAQYAAIDRAVPTTFDLGQQQNEDTRIRRDTTLHLWQLAESLKVRLSAPGIREVRPDAATDHANEDELLNRVIARVGTPEGMEPIDVVSAISISRQEVDALIDREIDETIGYANDLVRSGMETLTDEWARAGREPPLEVPEVDRVYIVGNASRYPRVRERLLDPEHGLHVRYIEERLADVRPEDLKNSVAKGAIVALRMRDMDMMVQVSWDTDFMFKLPFDMVGESFAQAGDSVVFSRGEPYSKELRAWREIALDPRSGRPTTQRIRLDRRWPGETVAEPYVLFEFDEPVAGRFVIRYDEERGAFVMHPDHKKGAEEMLAVAEPFEQAPYLAPPQSGRI
jgi:molecular chaperone DnaK (HSP70)